MKKPKDILTQPYHIQEYINSLEGQIKNLQEKALIEMMKGDEEIGAYQNESAKRQIINK